MCWRVDDCAGVLGGGRRIRWTGRASGRAVQGLGDRVWVGWDVGLVEYQYEGGRKGIAKCLVHLRMKQIYLFFLLKYIKEGNIIPKYHYQCLDLPFFSGYCLKLF